MFKKTVNFDVVIGEKAVIKGDIDTEGSVCIDGKVIGNIKTSGSIIVSANANIEGNIAAHSADIFGVCKGNIEATTSITVNADASLEGDAKCESIKTLPGCKFTGNLMVAPSDRTANEQKNRRTPNSGVRSNDREKSDSYSDGFKRTEISKLSGEPKSDNTKKYSRSNESKSQ